jgi:histidinol-phosphate/aromatic aminotransferase/cobyric acid decarboxylase-like protein
LRITAGVPLIFDSLSNPVNKIKYYSSHGNFILIHCKKPNELCSELKANGIYIRNRNSLINGCVRITIGNSQQTMKVINLLSNLSYLLWVKNASSTTKFKKWGNFPGWGANS